MATEKEILVRKLTDMKKSYLKFNGICEKLQVIPESHLRNAFDTIFNILIDEIDNGEKDKYGNNFLSWFIYESNFGKKNNEITIDNQPMLVDTIEKFVDAFLMLKDR